MLLDETVGEGNRSGVAFSPMTKIPDLENKVNAFLKEVKEEGYAVQPESPAREDMARWVS